MKTLYQTFRNKPTPIGNPIANVFVIVVGAIAIAASVILGVLAFFAIGSIILVMAGVIGVRLWWANRKLARDQQDSPRQDQAGTAEVIEGEYHVVSRESKHNSIR